LPDQNTKAADSNPAPAPETKTTAPDSAVMGSKGPDGYQLNRWLILLAGIALLLLMIFDLRKAIENKFSSLDKKANNFAVLFISIVVVAFMYWL